MEAARSALTYSLSVFLPMLSSELYTLSDEHLGLYAAKLARTLQIAFPTPRLCIVPEAGELAATPGERRD